MQAAIRIRQAVDDDAPALSLLAEKTFRDAFSASNTAANMQLHCVASYAPALQLAEIRDASRETWVADTDAGLVAYVQLRLDASSPAISGGRPVEIQRFYVDASHHGVGLAHQLMAHVLRRTAAAGSRVLWLGVWERNLRALAFYRKWDFEVVGEHTFQVGDDPQRDLIMRRDVKSLTSANIRDAKPSEIGQLAKLWFDGWHDAHAAIVPPELVALRTLQNFEERLRTSTGLRVADLAGAPIGFHLVKGTELYQFYVSSDARGTGVAGKLMADAEERLGLSGVDTAWLACAIGNHRAARFYEKWGWTRTGTVSDDVQVTDGVFALDVWRYEKSLRVRGMTP
jgi:ribosomal protein S18 acetylase RimI-like enzyme